MKRAANDWRQEVERKGRGGGEVVEDCALFIPADTSVCVIHLEKGISQQTPPHPPPTPTRDKRTANTRKNMTVNAQQGCKGELGQGAEKIAD